MDKNCNSCFFGKASIYSTPCDECWFGGGGAAALLQWVAVDFLKNVPDDTDSIEGEEVMNQMAEQLLQSSAADSARHASNQARDAAASASAAASSVCRVQSKPQQGVKYDEDKLQWSLLPFRALKEVVAVLGFGAKKYAPDNWQRVPDASTRYVDAAFRHLTDWQLKERLDGETGKSHLAHAICCLLFLLWFEQEEREDASPRVQ
jgi:hypothetical protein